MVEGVKIILLGIVYLIHSSRVGRSRGADPLATRNIANMCEGSILCYRCQENFSSETCIRSSCCLVFTGGVVKYFLIKGSVSFI